MMQTMRNQNTGRQQNRNNEMAIRDDDLTLFNDMHNKEQKNFLHPCLDDFDVSLSTKFGGYRNSGSSTPPWKSNDLLATDGDKSDYDWLLTPPGTPLFPSLDRDSPLSPTEKMRITQTYSADKGSRLSRQAVREMRTRTTHRSPGPNTPRSTVSSTGSTNSFIRGRTPSPSRKGSSPTPRQSTPTRRPSTPTHRPSTPTHRPSTPTHRPSTPTHRPSTPTHRPSTPTHRPATPPLRPLTPTKTLTRSTTILNRGTPRSSPPVLRRMNTSPNVRSSSTERNALLPSRGSSRGNSVSPKLRVWQSPEFGFGSEPPPNLRTSISERPLSASRGSILTACKQSTHSEARHSYSETLDTRWRNTSSSGSRISSSTTSQDRWSSKGSVISSSDDGMDVTEPMFLDCSLASPTSTLGECRFVNELTSNHIPSVKNTIYPASTIRPKQPSSSLEAHGLSHGSIRKALEPSMCHLDHHLPAASHKFRPLLSSAPISSFYNFENHSLHANRTIPAVLERSITASSNASSEKGVRIFPNIDSSDDEEAEIQSEWHGIPSPMPIDRKAEACTNSLTFNGTSEEQTGIESLYSPVSQIQSCETDLPRNGETSVWPNSEAFEDASNQRYDRDEHSDQYTDSTVEPNREADTSNEKNNDEIEPGTSINFKSCEMKSNSIPDLAGSDVLDNRIDQNCEMNTSKNVSALYSPVSKSITCWTESEVLDSTVYQNSEMNTSKNADSLDCHVANTISSWEESEVLDSTMNTKIKMSTSNNGNLLDSPVSELERAITPKSCDTKKPSSQNTTDHAHKEPLTGRISHCHEILAQKEEDTTNSQNTTDHAYKEALTGRISHSHEILAQKEEDSTTDMLRTAVKYDTVVSCTTDVGSLNNVNTECDNEDASSVQYDSPKRHDYTKPDSRNEDWIEHISPQGLDPNIIQESESVPRKLVKDKQSHERFDKFSCSVLDTRRKPKQLMHSGRQIFEKPTAERIGKTIEQEVCSRPSRSSIQHISETERIPAPIEIEPSFPSKGGYQAQVPSIEPIVADKQLQIMENATNDASLTNSEPQKTNPATSVTSSELNVHVSSNVLLNPEKQTYSKKSKKLQKGMRSPLVEKEDNWISNNKRSCDMDKEPNNTSSKFSTGKHEKVPSSLQIALSAQDSSHADMLESTKILEESKSNSFGILKQQRSDENNDLTLPVKKMQNCLSDGLQSTKEVSTIFGEQPEDVESALVSTEVEENNKIDLTITTHMQKMVNHNEYCFNQKEIYNEGFANAKLKILEPLDTIENQDIQSEKEFSNEEFADTISHILEPEAAELHEYVAIKEEQINSDNVHLLTESPTPVDEVFSCETNTMDDYVHGGQEQAMDSTSIPTIQKDTCQLISSESGRKSEKHNFSLEEARNTILLCSSIVHDLVYKAASIAAEKEESEALAQAALTTSQSTSQHSNLAQEKTSRYRRKDNKLSSNKSNKENRMDAQMAIAQQPAPMEAMKKTDSKDEVVQKPLSTVKGRNQIRFATNTNCHCTVM